MARLSKTSVSQELSGEGFMEFPQFNLRLCPMTKHVENLKVMNEDDQKCLTATENLLVINGVCKHYFFPQTGNNFSSQ
jgi:hypothetical protein